MPRGNGKSRNKLKVADIARRAGVGTATVDRVIHGRPGVKPHMVTHIKDVIQQMETERKSPDSTPPVTGRLRFDVILPKGPNSFYNQLENWLNIVSVDAGDEFEFVIHRVEGFNPDVLSTTIRELAPRSNGLVVVAIEDPAVREAVSSAVELGVPVVSLVSDLPNARHQAYVGIDNRSAGRTAGYLMGRFAPDEGDVLLMAGSMSLRDHEEREIGFRRILGEQNENLRVIARLDDQDDFHKTYEETMNVLRDYPNLVGIYNVGAGNRGIANALQEFEKQHDVVFIGHELTEFSRQYLVDGTMDAVIDQNPRAEVERVRDILIGLNQKDSSRLGSSPVPLSVIFRENLP